MRRIVVLVVLWLPLLAFIGGCGSTHKAQDRNFTVTVAGGKPRGGVAQLTANKGDTIHLVVNSDLADEIHVHGYDLHTTIKKPGGRAALSFKATIDGIFVIELESRSEQIASLRINP